MQSVHHEAINLLSVLYSRPHIDIRPYTPIGHIFPWVWWALRQGVIPTLTQYKFAIVRVALRDLANILNRFGRQWCMNEYMNA